MNKKTKGIIAGAAGVALLAGGATFATWSDFADLGDSTLSSGQLDIEVTNTPTWYDVSPDRVANAVPLTGVLQGTNGHAIDVDEWTLVPGDRLTAAYDFEVELEGDNLAAELGLSGLAAVTNSGGTVNYEVYNFDGTTYTAITPKPTTLTFTSNDARAAIQAGTEYVQVGTDGTADLTVVVSVAFDAVNQDDMRTLVADLDEVGVSLTQVRGTGVTGF